MIPPSYPVGTAAVTENLLKRRWSITILRHLANDVNDPADICRMEPAISMAAMNERLRNMLRFSLITRYPRASPSKVVEYRLTARGQKILKILNFIEQLDADASQQDTIEEERTLVTVRRKKIAPARKKMVVLPESPKRTTPTSNPSVKLAQAS